VRRIRGEAGAVALMTYRTDAWFDRQLAHAQECLAVVDKVHTSEELAAARAALAIAPDEPQQTLPLGLPQVEMIA
jgi:hypothetical protein